MDKKEQLQAKIDKANAEAKKARDELNKIKRQEKAEAIKAERQKQIEHVKAMKEYYYELCEQARQLSSTSGEGTLFDDFEKVVRTKSAEAKRANWRGEGDA